MPQSCLLCESVSLVAQDSVLVLNSAADPFVSMLLHRRHPGNIILAEDSVANIHHYAIHTAANIQAVAFHDYILRHVTMVPSVVATTTTDSTGPAGVVGLVDIAIMNLLYQPAKAWMLYGLQIAAHALRPDGHLYVMGAKERGILSIAHRMADLFGNLETVSISKGQRVVSSRKRANLTDRHEGGNKGGVVPIRDANLHNVANDDASMSLMLSIFAEGRLDEGTRLLIEALKIRTTDEALDIGCGAGFIGLHIARQARRVTMVDASLAAVAAAQRSVAQTDLTNIRILPSDGIQAVRAEHFDLVVTNPPFHQGGIQTTETAERFIREAAQVLHPKGRFYLVANRFLKYEPTLRANFKHVEEVSGNTRYKVLYAEGRT